MLLLLSIILCNINLLLAQWKQTNGPYGGDVLSFAVIGTNLFASTDGGGVFVSTNDGESWNKVVSGLINYHIKCLTVSGNNLIAGTSGGGVFITTNNGISWKPTNSGLPPKANITSLAVSGSNLYVGTLENGIFRSTSNGESWTQIHTGEVNFPATMYPQLTTINCLAASKANLFAGAGFGILRSTDNGVTWTAIESVTATGSNVHCIEISGNNIFAGDESNVSLSINNGTSWTKLDSGLTDIVINCLTVKGSNIFAGTSTDYGGGVFRSVNNGKSWTKIGLNGFNVNCLIIKGANLFAGTDAGIFRSIDNGTSWIQSNSGLISTKVYSLAVCDTNLFACTGKSGVFRSTDYGIKWANVDSGLRNQLVYCLTVSGKNIFASTDDGIFRSINNGTDWNRILKTWRATCLLAVNNYLFIGTRRDLCYSYTIVPKAEWNGPYDCAKQYYNYDFRCLEVSRKDQSQYFFAGTYYGGILRDRGDLTEWNEFNSGLPYSKTMGMEVMFIESRGANIFAGIKEQGVFLSTNNGINWTQINSGLPMHTTVYSLVVIEENIYVGTDGHGVFLSNSNGTTWTEFNSGLPANITVSSLKVIGTNLYAGTHGAGVWQIPLCVKVTTISKDSGTVSDIDGNIYHTIKIGDQLWMAENLKVTHYRNGDPIPHVSDITEWMNLTTGAYFNYDNNETNADTYGRLYNWYAVNDSRNIAPRGWHVPSDAEWMTLVYYLGEDGDRLKESGTEHWSSPNTGTNESGFTGLPVGGHYGYENFRYLGTSASFWTSSEYSPNHAILWGLRPTSPGVFYSHNKKQCGFSLRLVRD